MFQKTGLKHSASGSLPVRRRKIINPINDVQPAFSLLISREGVRSAEALKICKLLQSVPVERSRCFIFIIEFIIRDTYHRGFFLWDVNLW